MVNAARFGTVDFLRQRQLSNQPRTRPSGSARLGRFFKSAVMASIRKTKVSARRRAILKSDVLGS
jgi:hypothetical protein